jgi:hypothetical protein
LNLRQVIPSGGTNLERAFAQLRKLSPSPDQVILITDGLPTLADSIALSSEVTGRDRIDALKSAQRVLPRTIPVDVILMYLEGDPDASGQYWKLARDQNGSFFSPADTWP